MQSIASPIGLRFIKKGKAVYGKILNVIGFLTCCCSLIWLNVSVKIEILIKPIFLRVFRELSGVVREASPTESVRLKLNKTHYTRILQLLGKR